MPSTIPQIRALSRPRLRELSRSSASATPSRSTSASAKVTRTASRCSRAPSSASARAAPAPPSPCARCRTASASSVSSRPHTPPHREDRGNGLPRSRAVSRLYYMRGLEGKKARLKDSGRGRNVAAAASASVPPRRPPPRVELTATSSACGPGRAATTALGCGARPRLLSSDGPGALRRPSRGAAFAFSWCMPGHPSAGHRSIALGRCTDPRAPSPAWGEGEVPPTAACGTSHTRLHEVRCRAIQVAAMALSKRAPGHALPTSARGGRGARGGVKAWARTATARGGRLVAALGAVAQLELPHGLVLDGAPPELHAAHDDGGSAAAWRSPGSGNSRTRRSPSSRGCPRMVALRFSLRIIRSPGQSRTHIGSSAMPQPLHRFSSTKIPICHSHHHATVLSSCRGE